MKQVLDSVLIVQTMRNLRKLVAEGAYIMYGVFFPETIENLWESTVSHFVFVFCTCGNATSLPFCTKMALGTRLGLVPRLLAVVQYCYIHVYSFR